MDDHIAGQTAGHIPFLLCIYFLYEAFHHPPCESSGSHPCIPLHCGKYPVEAFLDITLSHLSFHGSRRCPSSGGVDKCIGIVKTDSLDDVQRVIDILRRLAGEPHDDIRRDRNVGDLPSDPESKVYELLLRVVAVHLLQDSVGAALERQVDMSGGLGIIPDHTDEIVREILGMRGHKADPPDPVHFAHFFEKLRKTDRVPESFAIGVDILSKQHDLCHAVCGQSLDLPYDLARIPAPLSAADIGNDAVAAEIVAAEHDIDAGLVSIFALKGQILHDPVGPVPNLNDPFPGAVELIQVLGKTVDIVCSEDQVDKGVALFDLFHIGALLHHAAAYRDLHQRVPFFEMADPAQMSECPLIGIISDSAGVEDHKIRLFRLGRLKAGLDQDYPLGIGIGRCEDIMVKDNEIIANVNEIAVDFTTLSAILVADSSDITFNSNNITENDFLTPQGSANCLYAFFMLFI